MGDQLLAHLMSIERKIDALTEKVACNATCSAGWTGHTVCAEKPEAQGHPEAHVTSRSPPAPALGVPKHMKAPQQYELWFVQGADSCFD